MILNTYLLEWFLWIKIFETVVVSDVNAFMSLCMGKKNEKYYFISISVCFCHIHTLGRSVYATLWGLLRRESWSRLCYTGISWQRYFHVHCCVLPVTPTAKCSCKTTDFLPLVFSIHLSPSFPSTPSVELALTLLFRLGFCHPSPNFTFWSWSACYLIKQQSFDS